jgi:hypothetical protein
MQKSMIYTPPPGYYDLPYTYAFDASTLANGSNYPNQQVYIQGGYGDFAVRRTVGLNRILATDGTGKFQLMRASAGVYQSSSQIQAPNSPELAIVPEEWYPETGQIGFDLFGINLPANAGTAQVAFQGVRRLKGNNPLIGYKASPKSFTLIAEGTLTQVASQNARVVTYTPVSNYDFLIYQIMLFQQSNASVDLANPDGGGEIDSTAVTPGPAGNAITIQIGPAPGNNLPFSISVVGTAINIMLATDAFGVPTVAMTCDFVVAQMNADPAVAALVTSVVGFPGFAPTVGPFHLTGGLLAPITTTSVCSLSIFDQNQTAISNIPILDIFYNGAPGTPYENGAVVPPLMFRRNTILEIDFFSQITDSTLLPTTVVVYLIGRKLYPCQ